MTIDEMRDKKRELEDTIVKLVYAFQKETGLRVHNTEVFTEIFVSDKGEHYPVVNGCRVTVNL